MDITSTIHISVLTKADKEKSFGKLSREKSTKQSKDGFPNFLVKTRREMT